MRTIYKYELNSGLLGMPQGAEILTIQTQNGIPFIWALVDTDTITNFKNIKVFGTGQEIPESFDGKYIGTFQQNPYVWHVFDVIKF